MSNVHIQRLNRALKRLCLGNFFNIRLEGKEMWQ